MQPKPSATAGRAAPPAAAQAGYPLCRVRVEAAAGSQADRPAPGCHSSRPPCSQPARPPPTTPPTHPPTVEEVEGVGGGGGDDVGPRVPAEVQQLGGEVLGNGLLPRAEAAAAAAPPAAAAQAEAGGQLGGGLQPLAGRVAAGLQQAVAGAGVAHHPAARGRRAGQLATCRRPQTLGSAPGTLEKHTNKAQLLASAWLAPPNPAPAPPQARPPSQSSSCTPAGPHALLKELEQPTPPLRPHRPTHPGPPLHTHTHSSSPPQGVGAAPPPPPHTHTHT